jgi:microcompartment protein CcmK/EutM
MLIARVVGTLVSTQKHPALEGSKLLLVQPLTLGHEPQGAPVLAIDRSDAGVGDRVLLALDGKAAMQVLDRGLSPVDAAVLGVIDAVDIESATSSARPVR